MFFTKPMCNLYDPSAGSPTETLLRLLLPLSTNNSPNSFKLNDVLYFNIVPKRKKRRVVCTKNRDIFSTIQYIIRTMHSTFKIKTNNQLSKLSHGLYSSLNYKRRQTHYPQHCNTRATQNIKGYHRPVIAHFFNLFYKESPRFSIKIQLQYKQPDMNLVRYRN